MTDYRLYCIRNDHFFCCEEFFADSDQAAATKSLALRAGMAAELWSRDRQVNIFETGCG